MTRPDFLFLCQVVDSWWGDSVRYLLHPLFLEHFGDTCFVLETGGELAGFLIGVRSQSKPGEAYVHLVSTAPSHRGRGFGRALYEHFFEVVAKHGCRRISAITVPYNAGSLTFHQHLGFTLRQVGASWQGDLPVAVNYAGLGVDCVMMDREIAPKGP
jgi:GNAT superfamily N-acetyltransferase